MSDDLTKLHNRIAGELVRGIVRPVTEAGGTDASIMVVVESVVLGVLLMNEKAFGVSRPATVERLNEMSLRIEERLAQLSAGGAHG